jgi:hypothetical protein
MADGDGIITFFMIVIISQLFFSVAINILTYTMPDDAKVYVNPFLEPTNTVNLEDTGANLETSLQRQTNMPLIDLGALAFYSGNIIIDLLLNFAFALPQMFTILLTAFFMLFSIDTVIAHYVQLFISVVILVWYVISLIMFLASLRTGNTIS